MLNIHIDPEGMAALHPHLFRTSLPRPAPTFSAQHAFAVAAVRMPQSPAYCSLLAASQSGNAAKTD